MDSPQNAPSHCRQYHRHKTRQDTSGDTKAYSSAQILLTIFFLHSFILSYVETVQFFHREKTQIKIGILLNDKQWQEERVFKWSIDRINKNKELTHTILEGIMRKVVPGDIWDVEKKTCELLAEGANAIIGPTDSKLAFHVSSICDRLDVFHMIISNKDVSYVPNEIQYDIMEGDDNYHGSDNLVYNNVLSNMAAIASSASAVSIDLSLPKHLQHRAMLEVIRHIAPEDVVYLYDDDSSVYNFQHHFVYKKRIAQDQVPIRMRRFRADRNYRDAFWAMRKDGTKYILLDVKCENLHTILKQAQQVSMMSEKHNYLVICPDLHTIDFDDFKFSKTRLLWFKFVDSSSQALFHLRHSTTLRQNAADNAPISIDKLHTHSALIHDAVETFAYTLRNLETSSGPRRTPIPIQCSSESSQPDPWIAGSSIANSLRTFSDVRGITGNVTFSRLGHRSGVKLDLMKLTELGPKLIGNWTDKLVQIQRAPNTKKESLKLNLNNKTDSLIPSTTSLWISEQELRILQKQDLVFGDDNQRDVLIVTSTKNDPFFMNKQTTKIESGNNRYEGYVIDLVDELSRIVGFDYVFKEVSDGKHGRYNDTTKMWNGMIGEIIEGKADLAVADLSITSAREDAVDFTLPFMSTGISILFKKPTTKELELFSFLSPFESHVWLYVFGAYISVSSILFLVGRMSPYEWMDPHPCRQEDRILRNQFNIANSFWFTMAAVMQQGSDLAPKSLSTRLVSAIWYFFTLIMISSYTANLAAFLTVEKVVYPIEKAEDLYKHELKIRYGCLDSGSTRAFFNKAPIDSTFRKMYDDMVFVRSNEEGTEEAEKGNYAFFMESASIEYKIERHCNLTQIGGLLDSKGYGIALAKNATKHRIDYRTKISEAILSLQESGVLDILKTRWWKEKRGGGACDVEDNQSGDSVKELTLANVGGVFVVLLMGAVVAILTCLFELFERCRREAKATGSTRFEHIKRRLDFAFSLHRNY